jgi:hypothetical protein
MSRADAEEQLLRDLEPVEEIVNDEVHAPLSQGQFDALCSLAFNIGTPAFRASELVRAMNNGRVLDAANGFDVWRKATVNGQAYVVDALMRRRTAEKSLFLRNEPAVPAPSAMLTPQADDGLRDVVMSDASGVIDGANIINADRVDPVTIRSALTDAVPPVAVSEAPAVHDDDAAVEFPAMQEGAPSDEMLTPPNLVESLLEKDAERFESDADDMFGVEDDADFPDYDINDIGDDAEDDFDFAEDDEFENGDDDDEADADADLEDGDDTSNDSNDDDNNDGPAANEATPLITRLDLDAAAKLDPTDVDTDTDPSDFAALISPLIKARETAVRADADDYPDRDYHGAESAQNVSAIASAATILEGRLSALLDGAESTPEDDGLKAMPTSLFQPSERMDHTSSASQQSPVDASARALLLSFPKRELVLDASVDAGAAETDGLILIDDLAADDAIRATFEPEIRVFDPDGDPAENAARYLERRPSKPGAQKIGLGLWIPIALGATLVGASAVFIGRGASQLITSWGPTAVTAAAITGGLMLLFTLYAMARIRFA